MRRRDPQHHGRLPRASGRIARLACARAQAAGLDIRPLLKSSGLSAHEVHTGGVRVETHKQIRVLELVAAALPDDLLGFHLSFDLELREIGLLYYTMASSATLGDALQRAARYSAIVNEGVALGLTENHELEIHLDYVGVPRYSDRQQIEFWMATLMRCCRVLTGSQLLPRCVRFRHHRSNIPSEVTSFFGAEIAFDADRDSIALARSVLDFPVVNADRNLNDLLVRYCEEALASRARVAGSIRSAVENAITPLLPHGGARLADVARQLGMSERTLARRLTAEGLNFNGVLEQLRADLAQRHLRDSTLSISQIAWLLGYQEVSAFTHAFKRWTGVTPSDMRAKEFSANA